MRRGLEIRCKALCVSTTRRPQRDAHQVQHRGGYAFSGRYRPSQVFARIHTTSSTWCILSIQMMVSFLTPLVHSHACLSAMHCARCMNLSSKGAARKDFESYRDILDTNGHYVWDEAGEEPGTRRAMSPTRLPDLARPSRVPTGRNRILASFPPHLHLVWALQSSLISCILNQCVFSS